VAFLDRVLDPPSYGFTRDGKLYVPSHREILGEFFRRLNVLRSRRNWLPLFGWTATLGFAIPLAIFFVYHFSWPLFALGFVYSMVVLGSHGTFWLHRYSTHRAYKFANPWIRLICRNLVVKIIPEEIYVISHHVHHRFPEKPGDPYNVHAGWLYCFLADVNHQTLNKDLSEADYAQVCKLLEHTGVRLNSYAQFRKWGSACHPAYTLGHYLSNWLFWYGAFYWIGGHALATALFGFSGVWAVGVRTFNYDGHGRGKDRRREGIDFNRDDLSVNQLWPGYVAGEWHNNHHLYPNGARCGFLPHQLDLPWLLIAGLRKLGLVHSVRDFRQDFLRDYLLPYRASRGSASGGRRPEPTAGLVLGAQASGIAQGDQLTGRGDGLA
jgi:sn-1 stearoyl-lipid 9-desaturase